MRQDGYAASGIRSAWGRLAARCQLCGRAFSTPALAAGRDRRIRKQSILLNTCRRCGRRVCDDCYVIDGAADGICRECAAALGIAGRTTTEILNGSK